MKMTQCDRMLEIMLENKWKEVWYAKDFQREEWFIGYEATARMTDLSNQWEGLFIIGKDGRFRTLAINWDNKEAVKEAVNYIEMIQQ